MATTLKYGSSGDEVKKLQETLNATGNYNLATDGRFGAKTQEAVKAYQKANGLSVDGIVGNNTWGALNKASTPSTAPSTTPSTTPSATPTTPKFEYADYVESDTVSQAKAMLDAQLNNKPNAYQSQWQNSLQDTIDKIMNREKFSYDLNGDALYQQYKDQYTTQGQMAMMDTMGQAAALTGGYGNSYASTAGNQAYQGYLQQLNDRVPELYQLALDKHNQEGQELLNQYALIGEQENRDYGRYRDTVSDFNTERDYLTGRYDSERSYDYGKYSDERGFAYGVHADEVSNQWKQKEFDEALRQYNEQMAYQKERDAVADSQWQQSYNLSKESSKAAKTQLTNLGYSVTDAEKIADRMAGYVVDGDEDGAYRFLYSLDSGNAALNSQIFKQYFGHEYDEDGMPDVPPIGKGGGGGGRGYRVDMVN
jgi:peptidoglycan hydrolase-like protein with peptidoglycan-binding domain